jgi:hypothetical protein
MNAVQTKAWYYSEVSSCMQCPSRVAKHKSLKMQLLYSDRSTFTRSLLCICLS